jgi:hypothetical protein
MGRFADERTSFALANAVSFVDIAKLQKSLVFGYERVKIA